MFSPVRTSRAAAVLGSVLLATLVAGPAAQAVPRLPAGCGANGPTSPGAAAMVAAACEEVNKTTWYTWGGGHGAQPGPTFGRYDPAMPETRNDPQRFGFDCSGYTRWAYARGAGRDFAAGGGATANWQLQHAPGARFGAGQGTGPLRPGDLVFFGSNGRALHSAVYLGGGQMAEAPESNKRIRVSPVSSRRGYLGAVRVL